METSQKSLSVQPVRTESLDLNLIDIPADTREHDPQEIEASARSQMDIGQLQPIAVLIKEGGRFDLIFGKGRLLSARKAGRTQIKADVYEGLTPYQRLNMIYSENERREPTHPLYKARVLKGMWDTGQFKTKGDLAREQGMSEAMLSQYLSFLELPEDALQIFRTLKISFYALQTVKTLTEAGQIQIAQELKEGKLKLEDVAERCKKASSELKKSPNKAKKANQVPNTDLTDPLGNGFWPQIMLDPATVKF